jgi:NodT family efflux transporter outer membrane factor (OMF) lipoprotein
LSLAAAAALLAGCTVGPDYRTPDAPVPDGWVGADEPATQPSVAAGAPVDVARWWTVFNDPVLESLIDRAVESNLDLGQATARVRQARATRRVASAALLPTVDASGSYRRSDSGPGDEDTSSSFPIDTDGDGIPDATSTRSFDQGPRSLYQAGFDAAWELDVFGGIRRDVEAADATLRAAVEDRRDVLITLVSEVAINYVDLRSFQRRLAIARKNIELQRQSAAITERRVAAELEAGLDRANAIALVASSESEIPSLESQERQSAYVLGVLLGLPPGALLDELSQPPPTDPIPAAPPEVPIGLPSELLRRRPDIRRADAQLHAATARVGVATADLFPRFSLTGSLGVSGERVGSLTNGNNWQYSFGPSVSWPLFDAGRIRSNIAVQSFSQEEALLAYRSTVLLALQDVEVALINLAKEQQRRAFLDVAAAANRDAVRISNVQYENGITEFIDVINAQRSLFSSEDALVQSDRTIVTNLIQLYKALGGGWEWELEPPRQDPAMPGGATPEPGAGGVEAEPIEPVEPNEPAEPEAQGPPVQ